MRNPLNKRIFREILEEFAKYAVIFALMILCIGFVSGFLVAAGSMIKAYDDSFEKYNIEDGHFRVEKKLNKAHRKSIEAMGLKLYENYYVDEVMDNESTLRIFTNREEVNRVCLMEGAFPVLEDEIAIDRMYADNTGLAIGDVLTAVNTGKVWRITGLVALSDYSALFANNNDTMFDSVKFGVSVVTEQGFNTLNKDKIQYSYSWKYEETPTSVEEENEIATDLMEDVAKEVSLAEWVPRYLNQAIQFTGEDMGSDKVMMAVLLYIIMVIMAFVFSVTISNTIVKESNVIGTLRASGYTRGELARHYMFPPLLVTFLGAVIGNILGYTVFKDVAVAMYYGSYSLPTFVTVWNTDAFVKTTIVPMIMMIVINYGVLSSKLKLSPLKFLRRDLSKRKQTKALPLSRHIPFFMRFRIRVILQNLSNYVVLFVGITFANLLLMFGLIFPSILDHYQETMENNLLCNYQYMLQVPMEILGSDSKLEGLITMIKFSADVETENEDAESFSAYSLQSMDEKIPAEEIAIYGIKKNSKYISVDFGAGNSKVYITSAYADKYGLKEGDTIELKEKYEDTKYQFTIGGIYPYEGGLMIFLEQEKLNEIFDLGKDYFVGYLSDSEITDIDYENIGTVIDLEALTKISRQLKVSMGEMMNLVDAFAVIIYMVLIYLLSKIIIEKNGHSISMTKILGYSNWEISRLYIMSTTMVVILCQLISLPLECALMKVIFREMIVMMISGWIPYYLDPMIPVKMFTIGMITYGVVALLEYRRIHRVPMDAALKNVE